jgi:hypothetical protein
MARGAPSAPEARAQREYSAFAASKVHSPGAAPRAIVESLRSVVVEETGEGVRHPCAAGSLPRTSSDSGRAAEFESKAMNRLLHDSMLRYASLAGAGLPAGERHLARTATRGRIRDAAAAAGTAVPARTPMPAMTEVAFTVTLGDRAPEVVLATAADGVAGPADRAPARPRAHKLVLLSY